MIFSAGGGAIYIVQEMRRQSRRERYDRLARRDKQRLRHGLAKIKVKHAQLFAEPSRTEFACFRLCQTCAYLADTDADACPRCASSAVLDLGNFAVADEIRDVEENRRREVPRRFRIFGLAAGFVVGALIWWLVHAFFTPAPPSLEGLDWLAEDEALDAWALKSALTHSAASILGMIALVIGGSSGARWIAVWLLRYSPPPPRRWRLPLPDPDGANTQALTGKAAPAETDAELLVAPFTGRPCLAFRLEVLFDIEGDARPPEWALDESGSAAIALDGRTLDAGRTVIDGEPERIESTDLAEDFDLGRFLRKRGLFTSDGEYFLFESILAPGDDVRAARLERGVAHIGTARPG